MKLLEVKNLNVSFMVEDEKVHVLNDVSLDISENEVLAVIGETMSQPWLSVKLVRLMQPSLPSVSSQ